MTERSNAVVMRMKHLNRRKYAGWRRHDLRVGRLPAYVDQGRMHLNTTYLEAPMPADMWKRAYAIRKEKASRLRGMMSNAAVATCGIVTFGKGAQKIMNELTQREQDQAFARVVRAVEERYGVKAHSLAVHRDETALHAHLIFDSRRACDGMPMSKIMKGSELQDLAAEALAVPGIVRGKTKQKRKEDGEPDHKIYNRSVQQLHDDLPREVEGLRATIAIDTARRDKLRKEGDKLAQRIAKLEEREELNERERKRLETYRRRLDAKIDDMNAFADDLYAWEKRLQKMSGGFSPALEPS